MESLSLSNFPHLAIIGAGAVGSTMGRLFHQAGFVITAISSQYFTDASQLANQVNATRVFDQNTAVLPYARLIMIATPDDQIATVISALKLSGQLQSNHLLAHFSGVLSIRELLAKKSLCNDGFSFHPLATIQKNNANVILAEPLFIGLEGTPYGIEIGRFLAEQIKAKTIIVPSDKKALYHASAVMASNYLVGLLHNAVKMANAAGLAEDQAETILVHLARQSLNLIEQKGLADSLTGPIRRGDVETIKSHLAAIANVVPEFLLIYKLLGRELLSLVSNTNDQLNSIFEKLD